MDDTDSAGRRCRQHSSPRPERCQRHVGRGDAGATAGVDSAAGNSPGAVSPFNGARSRRIGRPQGSTAALRAAGWEEGGPRPGDEPMTSISKTIVVAAVLLTLGVLAVWWGTDLHAYTKYEVIEKVEVPAERDDPLAAAGFYEEGPRVETVKREEFHLGLLPVPQGLFDKHALSVATLLGPLWVLTVLLVWRLERKRRLAADPAPSSGA
jgi:hypothetical protein